MTKLRQYRHQPVKPSNVSGSKQIVATWQIVQTKLGQSHPFLLKPDFTLLSFWIPCSDTDSPEMVASAESGLLPLLGFGFLVQGFRCFPWMAVTFFLKDTLNVAPSTLQILQNSANLPMVGKPFYGVISDAIYIGGQHRLPYIAIGVLLQAISWISMALLPQCSNSIASISFFLLVGNLGASITEVANDALVAETSKRSTSTGKRPSGELQSFVSMAGSAGGILGNLIGGLALSSIPPKTMFLIFGLLLAFQFFTTQTINENSLNLPKNPKSGIGKQLYDLKLALKKPEIAYSIAWIAASFAVIPILAGTMFYYQTQFVHLDPSIVGLSKVFGQIALLLWSYIYNRWLKRVPPRKLLSVIQLMTAVCMLSDILFVKQVYKGIGVSDSVYVLFFSGFLEVIFQFKILPFIVLMAKLCPPGCEGSLMAFLASSLALASIVSGYLGVALASAVGVSGGDFTGLPLGILIQAACTLIPLYWSSWIPIEPVRKVD